MKRIAILAAILALVVPGLAQAAVGGPVTTYLGTNVTVPAGTPTTILTDHVGANTFIVSANVTSNSDAYECAISDGTTQLASGLVASSTGGTLSLGPVTYTTTGATLSLVCYADSTIPVLASTPPIYNGGPTLAHATYMTVFK